MNHKIVTMSCNPWSLQQQHQFPLSIPEQYVGWCGKHYLWGSPKWNNCMDSCPMNVVARITHTRSTLKVTKNIQDNILYTLAWSILLEKCCPHALIPEWLSRPHFAGAAGTTHLLLLPPNKYWPNNCLLIAHHMVHFAGWSDVSATLGFHRPRTSCCSCSQNYCSGNRPHY